MSNTPSSDKTKPKTNVEKFTAALVASTKAARPKSKAELRHAILRAC